MATTGGNRSGGYGGLRARMVAGLAALGCAAALALGGLTAVGDVRAATRSATGASGVGTRPCVYADIWGVPGAGCGDEIAIAPPAHGSPCMYADREGVPGEGCDPARP